MTHPQKTMTEEVDRNRNKFLRKKEAKSMPIYPTLTKCMQCGTSEITEFFDQKEGRIFICWHCSHRVAAESPQSV